MQVFKIGQTKLFVIMQGCIFNLTVSHLFLPFRTPFLWDTLYETNWKIYTLCRDNISPDVN